MFGAAARANVTRASFQGTIVHSAAADAYGGGIAVHTGGINVSHAIFDGTSAESEARTDRSEYFAYGGGIGAA